MYSLFWNIYILQIVFEYIQMFYSNAIFNIFCKQGTFDKDIWKKLKIKSFQHSKMASKTSDYKYWAHLCVYGIKY